LPSIADRFPSKVNDVFAESFSGFTLEILVEFVCIKGMDFSFFFRSFSEGDTDFSLAVFMFTEPNFFLAVVKAFLLFFLASRALLS
jgi:hypothetical protein